MKKITFLIFVSSIFCMVSSIGQVDNKKKQLEVVITDSSNTGARYMVGIGYSKSLVKKNEFIATKSGDETTKFLFFLKSGIYYCKVEVMQDSSQSFIYKQDIGSVFISADQRERIVREVTF